MPGFICAPLHPKVHRKLLARVLDILVLGAYVPQHRHLAAYCQPLQFVTGLENAQGVGGVAWGVIWIILQEAL